MPASAPVQHTLPGLDTLRALAIALVYLYHYPLFADGRLSLGPLAEVGWIGVDLFFVLSGYLIGKQVLAPLCSASPFDLKHFYARRALRTWPAFWVVLAAYFIWPAEMGGRTPPDLWRFLTFTQNLGLMPGTAFSHAWSLCVEEQFYLLLPLVAVAVHAMGWQGGKAWAVGAGFVALGVAARAWWWPQVGDQPMAYYSAIYYNTLCRFDELLAGVAVAGLQLCQPGAWAWLMSKRRAITALALTNSAVLVWALLTHYFVEGQGYGAFMTIWGYTWVAWSGALWLVLALHPETVLHRWRVPGLATLAAWAYTLYLVHKPVGHLLGQRLAAQGLAPWPSFALVTLASLGAAAALSALVERPFMRWRDQHFALPSPAR
ncbi:MAG: acyltransferase [Ideonella sp. MAG2]|nr:MAG: acyltransferase [Ideonella sp. MAG2]